MTDYKNTLNLPVTDFPMKANLSQKEPIILQNWSNLYKDIRNIHKGRPKFILHDGPPYANGALHCGHALNKILKDIIVKYKNMSDIDAPFVPGWDCHGLPIELNVEKKSGKVGAKLSAKEFRIKCREYALEQINIQRESFKRLGVIADWENPYVTMDFTYEANIVRSLAKIIENGHLRQGFKPVHWCIDCKSSLAEAEVDYDTKKSHAIDVAFKVVNNQNLVKKSSLDASKKIIIPIWTTTPWTLPSNEAVAAHPTDTYSIISTQDFYIILSHELVEEVMQRYGYKDYNIVAQIKGQDLENEHLQHPFEDRIVPLVLGDHVTADAGTGFVHTAPAHGLDDYFIGLKYGLEVRSKVLENGCYSLDVPLFAGQFVLKANTEIIKLLEQKQCLLNETIIEHQYPHCWRHKTPVIFRATPQWFVSMESLKNPLLDEIENVEWIPDWGKNRIQKMIENRPDWCVSRQRFWSTPMPLFIHKDTGALHPNTVKLVLDVAQQMEKVGIEAWFDLDKTQFLQDGDDYIKASDTLDVWFDSGVSHFCVLKQHEDLSYPADLYLEGSDQHRGWFNSSLTTAVAMYDTSPFKAVLTHGYTVDANGKKLSKSQGNYIALDEIIAKYGADVLRLWVASTDYRNDVSISHEILTRNSDAYRRIRNTIRFLLANLFDFELKDAVPVTIELDCWVLQRMQILQEEVLAAYNSYQFHVIYQKIHHFCTIDLGGFYLDIIKDRQYTLPQNSVARRSCQTVMHHILHALTRLLAPILSFTAEEVWQKCSADGSSIFLQSWYTQWPSYKKVSMEKWNDLQLIRDKVNVALERQRQEGIIGSGLSADVIIYAAPKQYELLTSLGTELKFFFIISSVQVLPLEKIGNNSDELQIEVRANSNLKCNRCWHRSPEVGSIKEYEDLCKRCADNISNKDEHREYV